MTEAVDIGRRGSLKSQLEDVLRDHRAQILGAVDGVELALNARCDRLLQDMEVWRSKLADLAQAYEANEANLVGVEAKVQETAKVAFASMEKQGIYYGELAARVQSALDEKEAAASEHNREVNERLQDLGNLEEAVKECRIRMDM